MIRFSHWEYWSSTIIYLPLMPVLFYRMAKARSMFVFNAVNPGIENGGFTMESKWKIQDTANSNLFPKTLLVHPKDSFKSILPGVKSNFYFPVITKPDIGGKGRGVVIIENAEDLENYHYNCPIPYLIQEKINYPLEVGIFYVRMPYEATGKITGIVQKEFIKLIGDGFSSVLKLIDSSPRYYLQSEVLQDLLSAEFINRIPVKGEIVSVLDIGNHARGSMFLDVSDRSTKALTTVMDELAGKFEGFYFGRFDIRYQSWEELEKGEHFSVIELNGSGSEPTHIYDSAHSIFHAWKVILTHWKLLFKIGQINNERGIEYMNFKEGMNMLFNHRRVMKSLDNFQFKKLKS